MVPWRVTALEFSLATAGLTELEEVARSLPAESVTALFEGHPEIEELASVRTCHRVELLVLDREGDPRDWRAALPGAPPNWRLHAGVDAVHHLFRVAAGLESLAPGEREVREQILRTLATVRSRHPRPVIAEIIRASVASARDLDAPLSTRRSIAAIAATRVLQEAPRPFPRVVVVGQGAVGRQVVEALGPYARVTLVYRTRPPPDTFLRSTDSRAAPVADLAEEVRSADAVVAAAKSGERILRRTDLSGRDRGLVIVDLGLPRNVEPGVEKLPGVKLVDLEALYTGHVLRRPEGASDEAIARAARLSWRELATELVQPWADQLMRGAEEVRRAELDRAEPHLGGLSATQREAIDRMTRRLTERLLAPSLRRMRAVPPGPEHDRTRQALLRPWERSPPPEP